MLDLHRIVTLAVFFLLGQSLFAVSPPDRGQVGHWVTDKTGTIFVEPQANLSFAALEGAVDVSITLQTDATEQEITGFGGAMTHASAHLINNHPEKENLIRELFDRNHSSGIGASMVRIPIGTSDYALPTATAFSPAGPFSAQDDPAIPVGISPLSDDPSAPDRMTNPTYALDRDVIEVLKAAISHQPDLKFLAVPWSAPLRWKLDYPNNSFTGGSLDPQFEDVYAGYFADFIQFYQGHGIDLWAVSVQNEPLHGGNTPSMTMPPEQSARMIVELDKAFTARGLDTKIMVFDHNMENVFYPRSVFTMLKASDDGRAALERVIGTAWHIYDEDGDGDQEIEKMGEFQNELRDVINVEDMQCWVTERTGSNPIDFPGDTWWFWEVITYPTMTNEASGFLWWNFMLDDEGKPNLVDGDIYRSRGMYQLNPDNSISYTGEAAILGHFSKFIYPGSMRLTTAAPSKGVYHLAFVNPDGAMVVVLYNKEWFDSRSVEVIVHSKAVRVEIEPQMLVTLLFHQPGFRGWISQTAPGLTAEERLPSADPDGDGIPNFLEYAFNTDPTVAGGRERFPSLEVDDLHAKFTFFVGQDPSQLSYGIEKSHDLETWHPHTLIGSPLLIGEAFTELIPRNETPERRFFRLKVSE